MKRSDNGTWKGEWSKTAFPYWIRFYWIWRGFFQCLSWKLIDVDCDTMEFSPRTAGKNEEKISDFRCCCLLLFLFFFFFFLFLFFLCEEGGKSVGARARPSAASVASVWVVLTFFFFFSCCFFFHLIFILFFFSRPHSESLPAGSHIPQKKTEFQWQNSVTKNPFWEQTKKKRQVNPVHYVKNPVMLSTEPRKKNGVFFSFFF